MTGPSADGRPTLDPAGKPPTSGAPARGAFVSDRRYRFAADRWSVWTTMGSVGEYRTWWPWLRRFEANELATGDVWVCQIQPPMPYVLRFTVTVEQVDAPSLVVATVDGDVRGTARLDLEDDDPAEGPVDAAVVGGRTDGRGDGCRVRLRSTLVPANRTLRTVARLSRPMAQFGHAWVIDAAARQFEDRALGRP